MPLTREEADLLIGTINEMAIGPKEVSQDAFDPEEVELKSEDIGIDFNNPICPVDGSDMWDNRGTAKKGPNAGQPYHNVKCKKNPEHLFWENLRK